MLRVAHVSDTHGTLPPLPDDFDVIVHSGDFMPTKGRRLGEFIQPRREIKYQRDWVHRVNLAAWTRGKPFYLCPGNHDFYPTNRVVEALRAAGCDAYSLDMQTASIGGLSFYGFPWIPWIEGEWCREARKPMMRELVAAIPDVDVLVAHCPPYGVLDIDSGMRWGNAQLSNEYTYRREKLPRAILCGHVHPSFGVTRWLDAITVVNSATGCQLVTLE